MFFIQSGIFNDYMVTSYKTFSATVWQCFPYNEAGLNIYIKIPLVVLMLNNNQYAKKKTINLPKLVWVKKIIEQLQNKINKSLC